MKNGLSGLFAIMALSCCGMAFAADTEMKTEKAADKAPGMEKPMPQENAKEQTAGVKLKAGESRPKDRDMRHCLDLKDNAAIAKCAGE